MSDQTVFTYAPETSIDRQIACVERELRMRRGVYPRWVENGRMKDADATREITAMAAVLNTLRGLAVGVT